MVTYTTYINVLGVLCLLWVISVSFLVYYGIKISDSLTRLNILHLEIDELRDHIFNR